MTTKPQLWLAAIVVDGGLVKDPSRPALWLPNQNATPSGRLPNAVPSDNQKPRWAAAAVPIPN